ncbi:glycosyltransferase family 2 protein [Flavimaricola marinus]|uniref:PGL/p-HBAD biosynthesis glycosyltransferase/MT3031 n=1 Tax=Flavimaricola marinus TaxID=1819565 RepID=A0A238LK19_9RHOB|nr:glycosyltransferase [Flavimaricola marinus]SMY09220.1 PGL/p-HBAD biosynthesis glycosyltransferase/MT3031 [Flavimaricola marinus]
MRASIVIRTLNEADYLGDLLTMIARQKTDGLEHEVVVVDSGSTDGTVEIAQRHGARITTLTKAEFSFGRSLNRGCDFATGDILVFISGHCIPVATDWLQTLCQPIMDGTVAYSYGRQVGDDDSNFSERRIFAKYFPAVSAVPQEGFFCNNANAALSRAAWEAHPFDEELTGLEDMALAKEIVGTGGKIGYVAEAAVFHHHNETWARVRRRFEREAIALQSIMPEVQLTLPDVIRYVISSVWLDWKSAARYGKLRSDGWSILRYRIAQYVGSYAGNNDHRRLSRDRKNRFFYPSVTESETVNVWLQSHRRPPAHESQQPARER